MKKTCFVLVLCVLFNFVATINAQAEENYVEPRYNNISNIEYTFTINNDNATAVVFWQGYNGTISHVDVSVCIEKKGLLGMWWTDVESWSTTSYNSYDELVFNTTVGNGTYRCRFEVTVYSNVNSSDVITDEITVKN